MEKSFTPKFSVRNKTFNVSSKEDGNQSEVIKDYEQLDHKPQINGVTLIGNKSTEELKIETEKTTTAEFSRLKNIWDDAWNNV